MCNELGQKLEERQHIHIYSSCADEQVPLFMSKISSIRFTYMLIESVIHKQTTVDIKLI